MADIVFTINSFDHTANPDAMAAEILRIMKPGALFAASFNLYEPATPCEPQTLTIEKIRSLFMPCLRNIKTRFTHKADPAYDNFYAGNLLTRIDPSHPCIAWITGTKIQPADQ